MSFMDDASIEAALLVTCVICGVAPGDECVHVVSGLPLLDSVCIPVHPRRIET